MLANAIRLAIAVAILLVGAYALKETGALFAVKRAAEPRSRFFAIAYAESDRSRAPLVIGDSWFIRKARQTCGPDAARYLTPRAYTFTDLRNMIDGITHSSPVPIVVQLPAMSWFPLRKADDRPYRVNTIYQPNHEPLGIASSIAAFHDTLNLVSDLLRRDPTGHWKYADIKGARVDAKGLTDLAKLVQGLDTQVIAISADPANFKIPADLAEKRETLLAERSYPFIKGSSFDLRTLAWCTGGGNGAKTKAGEGS